MTVPTGQLKGLHHVVVAACAMAEARAALAKQENVTPPMTYGASAAFFRREQVRHARS